MGDEHEGPQAAPQGTERDYGRKAGSTSAASADGRNSHWTREHRRMVHGRNKKVVTPAGIFASASQAGEAHGFTRGHAAYLAGAGLRGWKWLEAGANQAETMPMRGTSKRPPPPNAKRVYTPDGIFDSATLAGIAYGIARASAARRAKRGTKGWSYEPRPTRLEVSDD